MSTNISRAPILALALVAALTGCATESGPISWTNHDDTTLTTTGIAGTGSGWVRPPARWEFERPRTLDEMPIPQTLVPVRREVPWDALRRLQRFMTRSELLGLLGEPDRTDVRVVGIDSAGNDWNATQLTWYLQDSRYTPVENTRNLVVWLAWVERGRPLPQRPEVEGPAWIVEDWELE